MSRSARREQRLHALEDGELRGLRARLATRDARGPEGQRELERVRSVGNWVRESVEPGAAVPDLWPGIAARLPSVDASREPEPSPGGWLQRPLVASAAVAVAAVALVVGLFLEPQADGDVVQWLDSGGAPVMVFDGPDDTIIWMLGPGSDEISRAVGDVAA